MPIGRLPALATRKGGRAGMTHTTTVTVTVGVVVTVGVGGFVGATVVVVVVVVVVVTNGARGMHHGLIRGGMRNLKANVGRGRHGHKGDNGTGGRLVFAGGGGGILGVVRRLGGVLSTTIHRGHYGCHLQNVVAVAAAWVRGGGGVI